MKNKTILITGATGSLGHALIQDIWKHKPQKVIVFSRDEYKQHAMAQKWSAPDFPIRYFIGDVRDKSRLYRAFAGVDCVIHCAALKQVPTCERDPFEAVQTNIYGAENVIDAAIDSGVKKVLAISSDKAVNPCNLYGATKLASDKLFIAANVYSPKTTKFSVIRFGNFLGSRGSVIPLFRKLTAQGKTELPITDKRMTRFVIRLDEAARLAFEALKDMNGGEIFVPRMPSLKIVTLAKAINDKAKLVETGRRPGEKIHEQLILNDDADRTYERNGFFVTYPCGVKGKGTKVPPYFQYSSDRNTEWLTAKELS